MHNVCSSSHPPPTLMALDAQRLWCLHYAVHDDNSTPEKTVSEANQRNARPWASTPRVPMDEALDEADREDAPNSDADALWGETEH